MYCGLPPVLQVVLYDNGRMVWEPGPNRRLSLTNHSWQPGASMDGGIAEGAAAEKDTIVTMYWGVHGKFLQSSESSLLPACLCMGL